jgi:hypothetical protein
VTLIAPTLQAFFTDRLTKQLHASPRTIASYRDSLRSLLCFAHDRTGTAPSELDWEDLDEPLIAAFLEHLETERHNSVRTRNLRLTAIRSLFRYASLRHPEPAAVIARVLSIPAKRFDRRAVTYLTSQEASALIDAAPQDRWEGRRDRAMLTLAIHAGLRVSELIARTSRPAPGSTLPYPHRTTPDPRRRRAPRRDSHQDRRRALPAPCRRTRAPTRAAAQLRDVAATGPRRQHRHRPLARARRHQLNPAIHPRRHDHQGTRARAPDPTRRPRPAATRPPTTSSPTSTPSADYADPQTARQPEKPAVNSFATAAADRPRHSRPVGIVRLRAARRRPRQLAIHADRERIARIAAGGIRLVIDELRTDVTKTRKDGTRGRLRYDYGDHRDPQAALAWLWTFIDAAKTAGELHGRALVVIAAAQHATRLVAPASQRMPATRWSSHKDLAAKALRKLAGPHIPTALTKLEQAVERAHAAYEKTETVAREHQRAERQPVEPDADDTDADEPDEELDDAA